MISKVCICRSILPITYNKKSFNIISLHYAYLSNETSSDIQKSEKKDFAPSKTVKIVKEKAKDVSYGIFVLSGLTITVGTLFYVFRELFSSESPQGIYNRTYKLCANNNGVIDAIGGNIKAFGETDRRGRRRHTAHQEWIKGGVKHITMQFYLEGTIGRATVYLEMTKNENNKYEYDFIIVKPDYNQSKHIVVVNRNV